MARHSGKPAGPIKNPKSSIINRQSIPIGILAFLLVLNQACAAKEAAGEPITPPGLPLPETQHGAFVTSDCIRV